MTQHPTTQPREGAIEALRERMADALIKASGRSVHASDCATSNAPAMEPAPCDCAPHPFQEALERIAACGPAEKPDGPYCEMGGYSSDNYGDVIFDAQQEAEWQIAEIARAALKEVRKLATGKEGC